MEIYKQVKLSSLLYISSFWYEEHGNRYKINTLSFPIAYFKFCKSLRKFAINLKTIFKKKLIDMR